MTETEIISCILKGDIGKYEKLVSSYTKMCFSVAYRIIQDVDDSKDVTQDAFIAAYENLSEFKRASKFSTWLYRIVANKALAFKNKTKYYESIDDQLIIEGECVDDFEIQNVDILQKALKVLSEKERMVIELFYYQEQSVKEIAFICAVSESNVKVLLHRSRKKMNNFMQIANNLPSK